MAKEICISSTPHETRLAILEDDQLAEIYYERENEYTLAGSIYNGRVTRVLPGMQSAFVDIGLERDAFLYVTDFLELEDPEETDEIEKATASGANVAPREVRHTPAAPVRDDKGPRTGQAPEPKPEQKQEPKQDRQGRDRRPAIQVAPETAEPSFAALVSEFPPEASETAEDENSEGGARRWRGRRRRRGGRGAVNAPQTQADSTSAPVQYTVEEVMEEEPEIAPEILASEAPAFESQREPRGEGRRGSRGRHDREHEAVSEPEPVQKSSSAAPVPFVLPGESLSKYGGAPAAGGPAKTAETAHARPSSSFKPSTMILAPIEWDGSGLLPGESLSKHRKGQSEEKAAPVPSSEVDGEPRGVFSDALPAPVAAAPFVEQEFEEESYVEESLGFGTESRPEPFVEALPEAAANDFVEEGTLEDDLFEEEMEEEELIAGDPEAAVEPITVAELEAEHDAVVELEPDAQASHHVDPSPSTGFRLFGLGGKKKKEEEASAKVEAAPSSAPAEEDFIEEEEFAAPKHQRRGKAEASALKDFEDDAHPSRARAGDAGSKMQEATRIQLEEGGFDDDEEDEESSAEGQPANGDTQNAQRRDRSDRSGRGRRGKGGSNGQPGQAPAAARSGRGGPSRRSAQMSDLPIISDLLKPGQEILVQIAKEPIAKKGARITSHIALPGRFLVFMPTVTHVGVSRKIESDEERQRLKRILISERGEASGGFIVRTAAEDASEEDLRADLRFLLHLWTEIKTRSDSSKSPALIYHDLSLIERILRDQVSSNFSNIWVDSEADYERIVRFLNRFSPNLVRRVKLYTKEVPLFEHFGIQDEISKALRSKVWLKSGGSIVINQTEALVAIDINTGKYVGKSARLEDTIVKTNLDAVPEIVRQIRLRDLGGIIVIDFIDMDDRKNRYKVMAALEEALKSDRAPTKVLQFNDFGLVAITRKRVKQSLERTLSVPCPTCQATGMVKSPTTVCNEIYTELRKMKKHFEGEDVMLRVNPETVKVLKANNASWMTELEEMVEKNILIKSDPALHPEQFDIQG